MKTSLLFWPWRTPQSLWHRRRSVHQQQWKAQDIFFLIPSHLGKSPSLPATGLRVVIHSKAGVMQIQHSSSAPVSEPWGKVFGKEASRTGFWIKWTVLVFICCHQEEEEPNGAGQLRSICTSLPNTASTDRRFRGANQRAKARKVKSSKNSYLSDCCSKLERKKCHQGQHNLPWRYWKQLQILPGNDNRLLFMCHIHNNNFGMHLHITEFWSDVSDRLQGISDSTAGAPTPIYIISLIRDIKQTLTLAPDLCPLKVNKNQGEHSSPAALWNISF